MTKFKLNFVAALFVIGLPLAAVSQETKVKATLTGASTQENWVPLNGACITAGDGTGKIPGCFNDPKFTYYKTRNSTLVGGFDGQLATKPDDAKTFAGALRLTNGDTLKKFNGNNQTGAVISNFDFDATAGLSVTFTTYTYGGNAYVNSSGIASGADGISFFLMDAKQGTVAGTRPNVGAEGGSLGYSCSNTNDNYDGVTGGYLGVGIDEYGNFANPGDNTATGYGDDKNKWKAIPNSISIRGAGSVSWYALNKLYPAYYPSNVNDPALKKRAIQTTCRTGKIFNASSVKVDGVAPGEINDAIDIQDYKLLANAVLADPADPRKLLNIYNQEADSETRPTNPKRRDAIPITYGLKLEKKTVDKKEDVFLSFSYSYAGGTPRTILSNQPIIATNGALPGTLRFGFSAGTAGGSNVHEITCFAADPINSASTSAGVNAQPSSPLQEGVTQTFLAYYHPINSWGQVTATDLVYNEKKQVTLKATSNWDASCVLSGGTCTAMGPNATVTAQTAGERKIITWSAENGGIPFTANQTAVKTALVDNDRVSYLRGDRSKEFKLVDNSGIYRARDSVLGDVINSSPVWVGPPSFPYSGSWKDAYNGSVPSEPAGSYADYKNASAKRQHVVYVGSNDGMLHGFSAGAFDENGKFDKLKNNGQELIAYMPSAVLNSIHPKTAPQLDFSAQEYAHNAFVDATPSAGDLFYGGTWHTWLAGGLGGGGNVTGEVADKKSTATGSLYILDVTDPSAFSEANAKKLVIGDWTNNSLGCDNNCKDGLGSVSGTPLIRRLHNGNWAVIFGNGSNSKSGTAGIYVMVVGKTVTNGVPSINTYFLDTGAKPSNANGNKNGIIQVSSADLDGDHITDYFYAGDLYGNLWRFDLTEKAETNWVAAGAIENIFSTPAGQPISSRVTVSSELPLTGAARVMISFGTGLKLNQTITSAATYEPGVQSIYGIWDTNLAVWNGKSSTQYAVVSNDLIKKPALADLQKQTINTLAAANGDNGALRRTISGNPVCWVGSSDCETNNNKYGWVMDLPGKSEQIIYNPLLAYGLFLVNTTIPENNDSLKCDKDPATGFTMAISTATGKAPPKTFFPDAAPDAGIVTGLGLGATGSPAIVIADGKPVLVQQTVKGTGVVTSVEPTPDGIGKRVNWSKLR